MDERIRQDITEELRTVMPSQMRLLAQAILHLDQQMTELLDLKEAQSLALVRLQSQMTEMHNHQHLVRSDEWLRSVFTAEPTTWTEAPPLAETPSELSSAATTGPVEKPLESSTETQGAPTVSLEGSRIVSRLTVRTGVSSKSILFTGAELEAVRSYFLTQRPTFGWRTNSGSKEAGSRGPVAPDAMTGDPQQWPGDTVTATATGDWPGPHEVQTGEYGETVGDIPVDIQYVATDMAQIQRNGTSDWTPIGLKRSDDVNQTDASPATKGIGAPPEEWPENPDSIPAIPTQESRVEAEPTCKHCGRRASSHEGLLHDFESVQKMHTVQGQEVEKGKERPWWNVLEEAIRIIPMDMLAKDGPAVTYWLKDAQTALNSLSTPSPSEDAGPVAKDAEDFWEFLTEQEREWAIEAVQAELSEMQPSPSEGCRHDWTERGADYEVCRKFDCKAKLISGVIYLPERRAH